MSGLTNKQIALLKVLAKRTPVLAPWTNPDFVALQQPGYVTGEVAFAPNGRLHSSKVWTITDRGRDFLRVERVGQ